jgi:hypothetical protein
MHGLVLLLAALGTGGDKVELPKDVLEVKDRYFAVPMNINKERKADIETIRVFVSENRGKTWKQSRDYKPADKQLVFAATRDDLYWFAVQIVKKDGTLIPATEAEFLPAMKVYVNTTGKAVTVSSRNRTRNSNRKSRNCEAPSNSFGKR